jgi:hypothetical protein
MTCARQEPSVGADVALRGFFRGPREEVRKTHRRGRHVTLKAMCGRDARRGACRRNDQRADARNHPIGYRSMRWPRPFIATRPGRGIPADRVAIHRISQESSDPGRSGRRIALGLSFLFPVADRLGILGPPGTAGVTWGNFANFLRYNARVNSFMPAAIRPLFLV